MPDKYVGTIPVLAGKAWDRAAVELHEYLRKANYAHNLQVDLQAISISGGNTTGSLQAVSSGTLYLSATNNITLNQSGQSIGISGPGLMSLGVSTGGNTAGTTGLVASRVVLYGGSNVSLSQSVSGQSATITWNVHPPIGIAAGTQTATTGTVIFSNSNGISFGMSGSNTITASYTVPSVTNSSWTASAGTTSNTVSQLIFSNSNNVSFGLNAGTITASVSTGTVAITLNGSNGSVVSNSFNFAYSNTNLTVYTTEDGIGGGVIVFSARDKYFYGGMSTGGNTAGTTGLAPERLVFVGSNNITLSQTFDGTNGTLSFIGGAGGAGDGYNILAAGTQTAATAGSVKFADSNGITFGMSNSSQITADFGWLLSAGTTDNTAAKALAFFDNGGVSWGMGAGATRVTATVRTDYASSSHSHGNPTLALTNLTGTTASASNGFTLSLSAAAPGGGAGATLSFFDFMMGEPFAGTSSLTLGISSVLVEPFILPYYVSASYIRIPVSIAFGSTAYGTSANNSRTYQQTVTNFFHIYSQGTGASSRSIQSIYSTSMSNVLQVAYHIGAASNNQSCTHAITYNVTGSAGATYSTSYSPAASSNARISTTHLTGFTGSRFMDIPFATLLSPGNYWAGMQLSSSTTTSGGTQLTGCSSRASLLAVTQISGNIMPLGVTGSGSDMWRGQGHGWWTSNSSGVTTASINLAQVSTIANQPVVPFQFIRQA